MMKPEVSLIENFATNSIELFDFCRSQIAWDGSMHTRQTASFGVPYNYSQMSYPAAPIPMILQDLMDKLLAQLSFRPNNCLANFYPDGGAKMGFHFDSLENLTPGTGVAIVSLGASRPLTFRRRDDKTVETALEMTSGSLLYMPPVVQDEWLHGILKSDDEVGSRISLTFRQMATYKVLIDKKPAVERSTAGLKFDCVLPFRELEAAPGAFATVFLALFDARVAGERANRAQIAAKLFVEKHEGFGDAVTHGARLTRHAAAFGEGFDVESLLAGKGERGAQMLLMGDAGEVFFDRFAVDRDGAIAGSQPNARDGVFALAGAVKCVCHNI